MTEWPVYAARPEDEAFRCPEWQPPCGSTLRAIASSEDLRHAAHVHMLHSRRVRDVLAWQQAWIASHGVDDARTEGDGDYRWVDDQGRPHRAGAPSALRLRRGLSFHVAGRLHRTDGPALIDVAGGLRWFLDGVQHRIDGPAVIHPSGRREWFVHGVRHRDTGPAVIGADGSCEYWMHGALLDADEALLGTTSLMDLIWGP